MTLDFGFNQKPSLPAGFARHSATLKVRTCSGCGGPCCVSGRKWAAGLRSQKVAGRGFVFVDSVELLFDKACVRILSPEGFSELQVSPRS